MPSPVFDYGAAKAAAEEAVAAVDPAAAIVRDLPVVSGGRGEPSRHERTCLDLARGTADGALFTDEIRCPIAADDLAAALVALAETDHAGVLNIAGPEALSRHELGVRGRRPARRRPARGARVHPCGERTAPTGQGRPRLVRSRETAGAYSPSRLACFQLRGCASAAVAGSHPAPPCAAPRRTQLFRSADM